MTGSADATSAPLPGGRLAFLFTDIEGSTQLWERDAAAMQAALDRHDALMREGLERHGGQVFKTAGDAFYAVFAQPGQALAAAVALQRALYAQAWPTARPIRVRMALHEGDAQWRQGDYFGPPLNVVARMLSVGRGGQALASAAVIAAAASLPAGARIERHGHFRMKGVAAPVEVCELGVEGMSAFAPPADTDERLPGRPRGRPVAAGARDPAQPAGGARRVRRADARAARARAAARVGIAAW